MSKVHGKRYAYKFDFHGLMAACQAQFQGPGGEIAAGHYKYQTHQAGDLGMTMFSSHDHAARIPAILPSRGQQQGLFHSSSYWAYSAAGLEPREPFCN